MSAGPRAVGDRVRVLALGAQRGELGTVVALGPDTFLPVTVYLDDAREAMGFNADELERVDPPRLMPRDEITYNHSIDPNALWLAVLREEGRAASRRTVALAEPYRPLEDVVADVSQAVESLRFASEFSLPDHLNSLRKTLEVSEQVLARLVPAELPLAGVSRNIARVADSLAELVVRHEASPLGSAATVETSQRAEASDPPRRDTGTVGDGTDTAGCEPRAVAAAVGGRAEPSEPAPADTTTSSAPLAEDQADTAPPVASSATSEPRPPVRGTDTRIGAASAHDVAPITDLTALRDAAYRLHGIRSQIDELLIAETALAAEVSAGLSLVVGMPSDLASWGADA